MSKELAVKDKEASFPALAGNPREIMQTISDNLGGENLTAWDLDRIHVPSGGGLAWTVPSLEGPVPAQYIEGVIIYIQNTRAYWNQPFSETGGGSPPDCVSEDAKTGIGTPGGECRTCPYAQFGSKEDGLGQACKAIKRLFMVRPDEVLPFVVVLPATSLKSSKEYSLRLGTKKISINNVVTRIGLTPDTSKSGFKYSKATFAKVGDLPPEMVKAATAWKEIMRQAASKQVYEDFGSGEGI